MNICFISEKWVDGNPILPRSTNLTNHYNTAIQCGLFNKVEHLFIDEIYYQYKGKGNINNYLSYLMSKNLLDSYDIIFIIHLGNSSLNPNPNIIGKLKAQGKKIIYLWPDTVWPWIDEELRKTKNASTFHLAHDLPKQNIKNILDPVKIYTIGTPQDSELFHYTSNESKNIDISFIGTQYNERKEYLDYLKDNLSKYPYKIVIGSGARGDKYSFEEYASILRRSKICINFTMSPSGMHQLKGRTYEAAACNTMLLESENDQTCKMFPDSCVKYFTSKENLVEKVHEYLHNVDHRIKIAQNAYNYYTLYYSPTQFWKQVLDIAYE
jgi:hypothetical protein